MSRRTGLLRTDWGPTPFTSSSLMTNSLEQNLRDLQTKLELDGQRQQSFLRERKNKKIVTSCLHSPQKKFGVNCLANQVLAVTWLACQRVLFAMVTSG